MALGAPRRARRRRNSPLKRYHCCGDFGPPSVRRLPLDEALCGFFAMRTLPSLILVPGLRDRFGVSSRRYAAACCSPPMSTAAASRFNIGRFCSSWFWVFSIRLVYPLLLGMYSFLVELMARSGPV